MKTIHQSMLTAAVGAATLLGAYAETTDITQPAGTLSATPTRVQRGTFPQLSWSIAYPKSWGGETNPTDPTGGGGTTTGGGGDTTGGGGTTTGGGGTTTGASSSSNFDLQDLALLVSYTIDNTKKKNNNGHGNNIDGVDSSNPGRGKGGPNGEVDQSLEASKTDPNVVADDEGKPVKFGSNDSVSANDYVIAEVTVLGAANKISDTAYGKITVEYRVGGGAWTTLLANTMQNQINPSNKVSIEVAPGSTIDFRAKAETSSGWTAWRETGSATTPGNVEGLVTGDAAPGEAFAEGRIQPYLSPYVSKGVIDTKGAFNVLYLFELVATN